MKHVIPHDIGQDLAIKATKAAFESYRKKFAKYEPNARWLTDTSAEVTFKVKMVTLKGSMDVSDNKVEMDLEVPLIFRVFKERALKLIESEVVEWIGRAKNGELD